MRKGICPETGKKCDQITTTLDGQQAYCCEFPACPKQYEPRTQVISPDTIEAGRATFAKAETPERDFRTYL